MQLVRKLAGAKKVDVAERLQDAGLNQLSHKYYPQTEILQPIWADREIEKSEAPPRFVLLYIHVLVNSMFPMWFDKSLRGARAPIHAGVSTRNCRGQWTESCFQDFIH